MSLAQKVTCGLEAVDGDTGLTMIQEMTTQTSEDDEWRAISARVRFVYRAKILQCFENTKYQYSNEFY
ncbi:hypothetical protein PsorP6_007465 [Peronosclerospora sorghi]|uniref:Uncharacterized protein n=1 Tax=Peronosclerospora sorghi TaxID=230839 RepID=A0ACC0WAE0_9STRA|nr:hypothetical protein PsorP6_007465 [Peronosclerospora sorghi]